MKTKIVHSLFVMLALGITYFTTTSSSTGYTSNGTSCGSCHGSANSATTVALTGLPTTFITGTTYTVNCVITNASNTHYGFNVAVSGGTLHAGTGSKLSGGQLTHTTPSTSNTFTFTWTAPTTTTAVTFNAVGNAVNGNGNDGSGDYWNKTSASVPGSFPASVSNVEMIQVNCYPNPTSNTLTLDCASNNVKDVKVFNILGQVSNITYSLQGDKCVVDCKNLPTGTYYVMANVDGKMAKASFLKN